MRIFIGDLLECVFSSNLLLEDDSVDLLDESGIFENQEVSIKNTGILGSQSLADLALHLQDFVPCIDQRLLQSLHFVRQVGVANKLFRNGILVWPAQDQNFS